MQKSVIIQFKCHFQHKKLLCYLRCYRSLFSECSPGHKKQRKKLWIVNYSSLSGSKFNEMYLVKKKDRKKSDSLSYPFISPDHMYHSLIHPFICLLIQRHVINLAQRLRHNDFLKIKSIVQAELHKGRVKLRMRL